MYLRCRDGGDLLGDVAESEARDTFQSLWLVWGLLALLQAQECAARAREQSGQPGGRDIVGAKGANVIVSCREEAQARQLLGRRGIRTLRALVLSMISFICSWVRLDLKEARRFLSSESICSQHRGT